MSDDTERKFKPYQEKRRAKYDKLLLAILDGRHQIETYLEQSATSIDHAYTGFYSESFEPPEFLDAYIMPFEPVTLDIYARSDSNGVAHLNAINLYPADSQPIALNLSGDIATLECGEDLQIIDRTDLEKTLRQAAPYQFRDVATNEQLLEYVAALSPELTKILEYKDESDDYRKLIRFTTVETVDDSIESLEVFALTPHPTGAFVGTHMTFSEALSRRQQSTTKSDSIHHRLTIDALHSDGSSESVFSKEEFDSDDWSIKVDIPVYRHLSDIVNTLKTIR